MAFTRYFVSLLLANAIGQACAQYTAAPDPNQAACGPAIDLMSSCVKKQIGYVTVTDSAEQAACVCYVSGAWNPNVFDNAYTACLAHFVTAAPSVYAQLTSDIGTTTFCGGMSGVTAVVPAGTAVATDAGSPPQNTAVATAAPTPPSSPADTYPANPRPPSNPYGGTAGNVQPPQGESPADSSSPIVAPVVSPSAAPIGGANSTFTTGKPVTSSAAFTTSKTSNLTNVSKSLSSTASIATVSRAAAAELARVRFAALLFSDPNANHTP